VPRRTALGGRQGDWRLPRERARYLERPCLGVVGKLADQTELQRLLRRDDAAAQDEVESRADTDDPRQPLSPATAGDDRQRDLREADREIAALGDPDVAAE
jgi:hypothetical protein